MEENIKKVKVRVKQSDGSYMTLHPESQADITQYDNNGSTLSATDVKEALDEIDKKIKTIPDTFVATVNGVSGKVKVVPGDDSVSIDTVGQEVRVSVDSQHIEGLSWNKVINKPFETVNKDDFSVIEGELQLDSSVASKLSKINVLEQDVRTNSIHILENTANINELKVNKQNTLIPGEGISITPNNIISVNKEISYDYGNLTGKPKINGVELDGSMTTPDLHIHYEDLEEKPDISGMQAEIVLIKNNVEDLDDLTAAQGLAIQHLTDDLLHINDVKQDKLIAGQNITIELDSEGRPVISSTGGGGGGSGTVKSVNNIGPDSNGNVALPIPTKISDLQNDSGFITNAVEDLVNYYKKSETYTQEEVNALIASIETLKIRVVDALPATGESGVLYLLRKQGYCEEYLWIENKYEKIGETTVDLSEYRKAADQDIIDAGKQAKLTPGNGISIDTNNNISLKIGNGLKHSDDGKLTIKPADRSISVGEFGVHVPVVTTSLDVTDNGLAVKIADNSIVAYNSGTGTKGIKVNTDVIQPKLTAGDNITIENNIISASGGGKLETELTANVTVGGVAAGTTFAAGTSLETILRQILIVNKTLTGISITTPPAKTTYTVGEVFNPAGMVVTANYSDSTSAVVPNYTYAPTGALATTDTKITVTYTEGSVTKTAQQNITVNPIVSTVDMYYGGAGNDDEQEDPSEADIALMTHITPEESSLLGKHKYENWIVDKDGASCYPALVLPNAYQVTAWSTDEAGSYPLQGITTMSVSGNRTMYYSQSPVNWPTPGQSTYVTVAKI